jgi:hypothetical protein
VKGIPIRPYWQSLADVVLPETYTAFRADHAWTDGPLGSARPFFSLLLEATKAAHRADDESFLVRSYAFAHWCLAQQDRDLWNSAGVAFFQVLFDDLPANEIVPWIAAAAFSEISPLLEARYGAERARKIRKRFEARKETLERNYPSVIARAQGEMGRAL